MKEAMEGLTKQQLKALESVGKNPINFRRYKPESQFKELVELAIRIYGHLIEYARPDLLTEELCLVAVKGLGTLIEYVPPTLMTEEIKMEAVKSRAMAIRYIPSPSEEVCKIAIKHDYDNLSYIPADYQTEEVCRYAIEKNPHAIMHVRRKTNELCLMAVSKDPSTLQHITKQTEEIVLKAIDSKPIIDIHFYEFIEPKFKTDKVNEKVVEKTPSMIFFIRDLTENAYLEALKQDGLLLEHVPEEKRTLEMCMTAFEQNPEAERYFSL